MHFYTPKTFYYGHSFEDMGRLRQNLVDMHLKKFLGAESFFLYIFKVKIGIFILSIFLRPLYLSLINNIFHEFNIQLEVHFLLRFALFGHPGHFFLLNRYLLFSAAEIFDFISILQILPFRIFFLFFLQNPILLKNFILLLLEL